MATSILLSIYTQRLIEMLPYFFSREESRMHVHVQSQHGEAKFWLEPSIEIAQHTGISQREINEAIKLVKENEDEIRSSWYRHFPS